MSAASLFFNGGRSGAARSQELQGFVLQRIRAGDSRIQSFPIPNPCSFSVFCEFEKFACVGEKEVKLQEEIDVA